MDKIRLIIEVKMKSGQILRNTASVKKEDISELEQGLIKQICGEGVRWWYFVDSEIPLKTHLINLSHVENINFYEHEEKIKCEESSLSMPPSCS